MKISQLNTNHQANHLGKLVISMKMYFKLIIVFFSSNNPDAFSSKLDTPEPMSQGFENQYDVEKFAESLLPYGIQNVRDLMQFNDRPLRTKPVRDLRVFLFLNHVILRFFPTKTLHL